MWPYKEITRDEFESIKDRVEGIITRLGGVACEISLPYENKTTSLYEGNEVICVSNRPTFMYHGEYFRVDEICFSKPCIVIERGDYADLLNNQMEEAEPFPYDLSEDMLMNEVKSLGILPYPEE